MNKNKIAFLSDYLKLDPSIVKPHEEYPNVFLTPQGTYMVLGAKEQDVINIASLPPIALGGSLNAYLLEGPDPEYLKSKEAHVANRDWTKADTYILDTLDLDKLDSFIRFLESRKEREGINAKTISDIAHIFTPFLSVNHYRELTESGLSEIVSFSAFLEKASPWFVYCFIMHALTGDYFMTGLLKGYIENGVFLSLLTKLREERAYYEFSKGRKVLFLDIDGVMNSVEGKGPYHADMEEEKLIRLKRIIEELSFDGVVLISDRRFSYVYMRDFKSVLNKFSIPYLGMLREPNDEADDDTRGKQIGDYLLDEEGIIEDYIILDDNDDGIGQAFPSRYIKVNKRTGLDEAIEEEIKARCASPNPCL